MIYKIGSGSGNISVTAMGTYKPGDVLDIVPGSYGSLTFNKLNGISITASGGKVNFSNTFSYSGNIGFTVDWTNLNYTGTSFATSGGQSNNQNITHNNPDLSASNAAFFIDMTGSGMVYAGTPATTLYTNLAINNIKVGPKTGVFNGTYDGVLTLHNIIMGFKINGVTIVNNASSSPQRGRGNSIYGFEFDNVTISGPTLQNQGDIGMFQIVGFGNVTLASRRGGWGYFMRIINADITGKGSSTFTNILDADSTTYGSFDARVDSQNSGTAGAFKITGAPFKFVNMTSVNKKDTIGYVSPGVVLYGLTDAFGTKFPCVTQNCFGANNVHPANANNVLVQEFDGVAQVANNISVDGDTSKYMDPTTYLPIPGGPLFTAGGTVGYLGSGATPPPVNQIPVAKIGSVATIVLPINSVTLDGTPSSDPDGTIVGYAWSIVSGPGGAILATPTAAKTLVTGLVVGIYSFGLVVTDNQGAKSPQVFCSVIVNPPLPAKTITDVQTVTDSAGNILSQKTYVTNL